MLFCPKCGNLLRPSDGIMKCSCGYSQEEGKVTEKKKSKRKVEVVQKKESYPAVDGECPKCKHNKLYNWSLQTRSSDEPETQFFKCVKCGHTWREY